MSGDFWFGLAIFPALVSLAGLVIALRWFAIYRIQRLARANPQRRAALAARIYASHRAYIWAGRHASVAVTLGHYWPTQDRAEAVLLDEFVPIDGDGTTTPAAMKARREAAS